MQLNGALQIDAPRDEVLAAMDRPEVLRALLPGEAEVRATGPGAFAFTLRKTLGFLELRQGGTMQVERTAEGAVLKLQASHRLGGSAEAVLKIALQAPAPRRTRIAYDATVAATGLAGRLLRDREAQVRPFITKVLGRLRAQIETAPSEDGQDFRPR